MQNQGSPGPFHFVGLIESTRYFLVSPALESGKISPSEPMSIWTADAVKLA